ncbi:MAG: hypothetical protein JWN56_2777 [Sphingobacteriales bacterium]|nr:hypothetical protein [Sphingobacteriales bacterium]
MTIYEFLELNFDEQQNALLNGVLVANRRHSRGICQLYILGDFFVEILYGPEDFRILKLQPLVFNDSLEPYLSQISIDDLNI